MDQRADLYALGALLYELATGAPPFGAGDPLELSRDHLARVPVPPVQVNPAAHATNAMVSVAMTEEGSGTVLRVRVRDDGCGGTDLTRGTGPIGLVDRAEALGGRLLVQSPPGAGTTLHAELPAPDAHTTSG